MSIFDSSLVDSSLEYYTVTELTRAIVVKSMRPVRRWRWRARQWWRAVIEQSDCPDCGRKEWYGNHDNCIPF